MEETIKDKFRPRLVVIYPPAPKQNAKSDPFQSVPATIPAQSEPVALIAAPEPDPVAALKPDLELDPGLGNDAPAQRALFWDGAGQKPGVSKETAAWLAKQKGKRLLWFDSCRTTECRSCASQRLH